jgi:class 3 adenylate cyclase
MSSLPSGTVTFLFTDIEGSTKRWERDRNAMAAAVARHVALVDAAIQEHGGVHFKIVDDAAQAAFPTAPEVVAAAVEGRALLMEEAVAEALALAEGETREAVLPCACFFPCSAAPSRCVGQAPPGIGIAHGACNEAPRWPRGTSYATRELR